MMLQLKNMIVLAILILTYSGCYLDFDSRNDDHSRSYTNNYNDNPSEYLYYVQCHAEPYNHGFQWCDLYAEAECCTWYIDGWYEEWCDWDFDGCWDYNRSF
jgi:hypothetical protein